MNVKLRRAAAFAVLSGLYMAIASSPALAQLSLGGDDPITSRLQPVITSFMNNLGIVSVAAIIGAIVFLGFSFFTGRYNPGKIIATIIATFVIVAASTIGQFIAGNGSFSWNSNASINQSVYGGR